MNGCWVPSWVQPGSDSTLDPLRCKKITFGRTDVGFLVGISWVPIQPWRRSYTKIVGMDLFWTNMDYAGSDNSDLGSVRICSGPIWIMLDQIVLVWVQY